MASQPAASALTATGSPLAPCGTSRCPGAARPAHRLVRQAAGDRRALLVEHQLLEEPPAHSLDRATVHLGLDRGWIERSTHVLDRDVADRCDMTFLRIDVHAGDVHSHARAVI